MNISELYTRPAFNLVSLAPVTLSDAGKGLYKYVSGKALDVKQPALQAFAFYYLDHCVALIKGKYPSTAIPSDLGEVVSLYHALTTKFGTDMYAYLFLICNREFRYCQSGEDKYVSVLGDTPACKFAYDVKSTSSDGAFKKLYSYTGSATLGSYCEAMTKGYNEMSWSSAYGGKKWGDIAKVLENYVLGRIPLMTLLDQSFSLQHNTCAIFNKGTIYEKESPKLLPLLDLQHAGQILALAYDLFFCDFDGLGIKGFRGFSEYSEALKQAFVIMAKHFDGLNNHVNWDEVISGKHATGHTVLASYKKDWYAKFGIYTVNYSGQQVPHTEGSAPEQEATYYHLAPNEKYKTYKRTKA